MNEELDELDDADDPTSLIGIRIARLGILNVLRHEIGLNSIEKGWEHQLRQDMTSEQWSGRLGELVRAAVFTANQHGEASEFWEAFRAGKLDQPCDKAQKMRELELPPLTNGEEELADEIIRALDKAFAHGIDVAKAVSVKMAYNSTRPKLHGGKKA